MRNVRPLDDAFATEMRDLAELKARIRLNLEGEARLKTLRDQEEAIVDQIIAKNPLICRRAWWVRVSGRSKEGRQGVEPGRGGAFSLRI